MKTWFTVFSSYKDSEEPFNPQVEAIDVPGARAAALRKAEGLITITGIVAGRLTSLPFDGFDNVVPIRGKGHAIVVAHVSIAKREIVVPGSCPKCKKNLRRAGAMIETYFRIRHSPVHLSHNGKDVVAERDGSYADKRIVTLAALECESCTHKIWDGLHGE